MTVDYGFALSSEEHEPLALVELARRAEQNGFTFALISDHYHPWIDRQGQSPFVWSVIGAIATATERLRLGTGVTCPTVRIHPAVIAQATATCAAMMDGRFFLGVGTGEALNEHILGDRWPETDVRLEMLEEAVHVIRLLLQGGTQSHHGKHYTVENARLYTLPRETPAIYAAAGGPKAARVAARIGDGLISTSPDAELLTTFDDAGGKGPTFGQLTVCWADDRDVAVKTLHELWPNAGITGELSQELPSPHHFEQAAQLVTPEDLAGSLPVGPDPGKYREMLGQYRDAGFTHIYVHQVGPDQEGFFRFWEREIAPGL
jgi:G6PDH family F420-dependent oxidoreductase